MAPRGEWEQENNYRLSKSSRCCDICAMSFDRVAKRLDRPRLWCSAKGVPFFPRRNGICDLFKVRMNPS